MPKKTIVAPDPGRFNLTSFADILPGRDQIIGEEPGSFLAFHTALTQDLAPTTPYECVVAENLVSIEWELLLQRRMRETGLRDIIRDEICKAVAAYLQYEHEVGVDEQWDAHIRAGGTKQDWQPPDDFDEEDALAAGLALADRAISDDIQTRIAAHQEIASLGLEPFDLMKEAYRSSRSSVTDHDSKVQQLEKRRREVKRDYDLLQRARPIQA
ncbi:hypothetical protein ACFQ3C_15300 [Seohaeicola saemankumensis]|uniref:Uncharacterized protein n=1 Tax=Seohaeicola saemankumensis TaxID=481181 RepID=A0ABW3TFS1_9RHOB